MTTTVDVPVPARVLAVGAHPDDIEFGCGATLAKWADVGAHVTMCVCTDGAKGTWDGGADLGALVARREDEQRAAAAVLGAQHVEFLRFVDGELAPDRHTTAALCRVIRIVRPDVVLAHDPWRTYRLHPDHRAAGTSTVDAIVAARDHHFFPEQNLPPHRPSTLLCFEAERVDHVEDVRGFVGRKVDALLAHRSQWQSTMHIHDDPERELAAFRDKLDHRARAAGLRAGLRAGEAFARLDVL
jgi:LmbE family N-acetylglucosaminyl deacetylase